MNSSGGRPASEPGSSHPDLLVLRGLRFFGHHGVSPAERLAGGEFTVDLEVEADTARAMATDDVADTVNYVDLYQVIRKIVEESEFHLLEAMASRIGEELLKLPRVERLRLRVTKLPKLPAQDIGFAVEISRPD